MGALTSASNTNSPVRCVGAWTRCEHEQPKALRAVRGPVGRWARGRMGADSCPSVQERSTRRCLGAARGTWLHFQRSEAISTFSGVPKRFCFSVLKRWFCQRSGATHSPILSYQRSFPPDQPVHISLCAGSFCFFPCAVFLKRGAKVMPKGVP